MTTTTPNMNLVLPDVLLTPGPTYANLINTAQAAIDAHDHSSGKGVRITPSGLNISSDLSFQETSNATNLRTVRFYNNTSISLGAADRGCFYVLNNELYFIDGAGNSLQLTLGGSLNLGGTVSLINIKDTNFTMQYAGDTTIQAKFNLSALTTGTTTTYSLPNSGTSDTLVTQTATQTMTNKTMITPIIGAIKPTGGTTLTLPVVTDTVATLAATQTLTNKTLSGNIATNLVSGAATITLPTVTGTLATLAGTETLTNKTLGQTVVNTGNAIRFNNAADTFYTSLKGANVASNSLVITLPASVPAAGQFLQATDTTGTLTWGSPSNPLATVAANDSNKTFVNADGRYQFCTVTAARTYTMPTTSIPAGDIWDFFNNSNFLITVNASGGALIGYVFPNSFSRFISKVSTPTVAADWGRIDAASGNLRSSLGTAPATGYVGEHLVSVVSTPTNFPASTAWGDATSLALSAGTWDLVFQLVTIINGSTASGGYSMAITATAGNSSAGMVLGDNLVGVLQPNANSNETTTMAPVRLTPSSATTYYAKILGNYSAGTPQYVCRFRATRVA